MMVALYFYVFLVFLPSWLSALHHAWQTPRTGVLKRSFWIAGMIINPFVVLWYWYIWKRRVFWVLAVPAMSFLLIEAVRLSRASGQGAVLFGWFAFLFFPVLLYTAALTHLSKNTDFTALQRNDWIMLFVLPVFGFWGAFAYCLRLRKAWALSALVWFLAGVVILNLGATKRLLFVA